MVKHFCHYLKRKMKITINPRPIGTEFMNASCTRAVIVTNATAQLTIING